MKIIFFSLILVLMSCGKKNNNAYLIDKGGVGCTTSTTSTGVKISCTDGSSSFIPFPSNGKNGSSCTVEQKVNGARISCTDGSFALIYNGLDGKNGEDGKDGSSCSVSSNLNGATITCDDGSKVDVANGSDGVGCMMQDLSNGALITCGSDSAVIFDGEDALAGAIGIANYIYPCGKEFNNDEIFLRLTDGNILALYDGGPNEDRLVLLAPGNYITTDRNKNHTCHFTIDSNLDMINEQVK